MRKALVIGMVTRTTTTANHGCTGTGGVYPVGGRTLYAGETVGVKVPARYAGRSCATGCRAVVVFARLALPTNCWNLNMGTIPVLIHVRREHHKPKAKPKPKVAEPAASAALSCSSGGIVVTLSNGASATAPATFEVNRVTYGPVAAGASLEVTVPVAAGTTNYVTVSSGDRVFINDQAFGNTCTTAPTTVPSATAALSCSAGGVVVTLSNAASATQSASFTVNGTAYGPVAPGASQTVTVPVSPEATVNITVISGSETLIDNQPYTSNCAPAAAPAPSASSSLACANSGLGPGGTLTVTLTNGATATALASFTVSTSQEDATPFSMSYGPIAPGTSEQEQIPVGDSSYPLTVTVTSGGTTIYTDTYEYACGPTE